MKPDGISHIDNHLILGHPDAGERAEGLECPRCKEKVYDLIEHEMSIIMLVKNNSKIAPFKESFCEECIKLMTNYFMCLDCGEEFLHTGIASECPMCKSKYINGDNPEMNELILKTSR